MVFCRTKRAADRVAEDLDFRGFAAAAVHGDLGQGAREQALRAFRSGKVDVLVATDVAARGIDVTGVSHVVNYQCPEDEKTYVHRIGRTGRAGAEGLALSLASLDEMGRVGKIEQLQGRECEWHPLAELACAASDAEGPLQPPMATLQITGGRKDKIRAGDVLGALTGEAGFTREQVGKISINEFSTYVAVDRRIAREAAHKLSTGRVKGRSVKVRLLDVA
jgi:ATP-independent RNA helicase DbpA